jgi:hypothetical protein
MSNPRPIEELKRLEAEAVKSVEETLGDEVFKTANSLFSDEDIDRNFLIAGGTLALIVSNGKDLIEVCGAASLKWAIWALLLSGLLGVIAKNISRSVRKHFGLEGREISHARLDEAFQAYRKTRSGLQSEAEALGQSLPHSLSFDAVFDVLHSMAKKGDVDVSEMRRRNKDARHRWEKPVSRAVMHSTLSWFQMITLFLGLAVLALSFSSG